MNGRPALGISALPGSARRRSGRPSRGGARDVAVADRLAVARQVGRAAARELERARPRGARRRVRAPRASRGRRPAGRARRRRGRRGRARRRRAARRPSDVAARRAAGWRGAARARCRRRAAGSAAGSVADVLTTTRSPGAQEVGQVARPARARAAVAARRRAGARRRARARAPRAARGPRAPGQLEGGLRAHAATVELGVAVAPAGQVARRSGRAARARCPRAAGGRRCPRPGTPPGASRCACRRGRRRRRARLGCSAARIGVSCSSAAFDEP